MFSNAYCFCAIIYQMGDDDAAIVDANNDVKMLLLITHFWFRIPMRWAHTHHHTRPIDIFLRRSNHIQANWWQPVRACNLKRKRSWHLVFRTFFGEHSPGTSNKQEPNSPRCEHAPKAPKTPSQSIDQMKPNAWSNCGVWNRCWFSTVWLNSRSQSQVMSYHNRRWIIPRRRKRMKERPIERANIMN